jgi:hypothetical protein
VVPDQTEAPIGGAGCLVRLYWIFLGNALLLILLVFIVEKRPVFPSLIDLASLATVASLIAVRYVDVRLLNGQTGTGDPATMTHWRRYAMLTGIVGVGLWLLARVLTHSLK